MTKKVTLFDSAASPLEAPQIHCWTPDQYEVLWYTKEELCRLEVQIRMLLRRPATAKMDASKDDSWRGLELRRDQEWKQKRKDTIQAIVVQQQQRQQQEDLASTARKLTQEAVARAIARARQDRKEVEED